MRKDKDRIIDLRQQGRTYREIQRDTGVSRATLSTWFKGLEWSKHLSEDHRVKNRGASRDRMERMNMVRKLKLQYTYALMEAEAQKEYEVYKKDPLFWAGLMTYAGEGDKRSEHQIRVSNSEAYIHRIFIRFIGAYLQIPIEQFRYSLIIYPDNNPQECLAEWSKELGAPLEHFYIPQVIQGKEVLKRLRYGTCISIISNTARKKKLLKWLTLAQNERFEAGMVQG